MQKGKAKQKIEKWLEKIPKSERDVPYFKVGGRLVSPREALEELDDKPKTKGAKEALDIADDLVDQLDPETPTPLIPAAIDDIVVGQIKARLEHTPVEERNTLSISRLGKREVYSMQSMYDAIMADTEDGKEFRMAMAKYYQKLMRRLEKDG